MNYCAVICEYNPFHNGHLYQLEQAKAATNCDGIICVMSGDFVQRAEPAFLNKYLRTVCALRCGADMVIELPALYATANGERFAKGAVDLICKLPNVTRLVMGCEADDEKDLTTLAEIQANESEQFKNALSMNLEKGLSYAKSYAEATAKCAEARGLSSDMSRIILSKPNNLLCLEYIKALKAKNSNIKPLIIKRKGDDYNSLFAKTNYASAAAIRKILAENTADKARPYLPENLFDLINNSVNRNKVSYTSYSDIVMYSLKTAKIDELRCLPDIGEGIENRILEAASKNVDLNSTLNEVKSKRYTLSRLKRICLELVLGIESSVMSDITESYAHILGIKEDFKYYLGEIPKNFYVQISDNEDMPVSKRLLYGIEKRTSALYSLLSGNENYSYYNKLITL